MALTKKCFMCGEEFEYSRINQKFCSQRCRRSFHKNKDNHPERIAGLKEAKKKQVAERKKKGKEEKIKELVELRELNESLRAENFDLKEKISRLEREVSEKGDVMKKLEEIVALIKDKNTNWKDILTNALTNFFSGYVGTKAALNAHDRHSVNSEAGVQKEYKVLGALKGTGALVKDVANPPPKETKEQKPRSQVKVDQTKTNIGKESEIIFR